MYLSRDFYAYKRTHEQPAEVAVKPSYPAAPDSSWLIFSTTDRDTRSRTNHARLRADVPTDPTSPAPAPAGDYLELRVSGHGAGEAVVVLASVPAAKCAAIDHVAAAFDSRKAESLAAETTVVDAGCSVKIAGYGRFVQGLLNAQTLVLTPQAPGGALRDVALHVAGLTWESE